MSAVHLIMGTLSASLVSKASIHETRAMRVRFRCLLRFDEVSLHEVPQSENARSLEVGPFRTSNTAVPELTDNVFKSLRQPPQTVGPQGGRSMATDGGPKTRTRR